MYGQVYANHVLYKDRPEPNHRFRQIVVVELEQFQLRILGGDVIQEDPQFSATNPDAELYIHPDLKSALDDADKEVAASVEDGWIPYP